MLTRSDVGSARVAFGITGEATRTPDLRIMRPQTDFHNDSADKDLRQGDSKRSHHFPTDNCKSDPGLALVIEAWDRLPEAVHAGIVAMVKASAHQNKHGTSRINSGI
jgi:hypothetical protein